MNINKLLSIILICTLFSINSHAQVDFAWAKQIKSPSGGAEISKFILDANGNSYITGEFNGVTDFDPGVGVYNLTAMGDWDAFICKLDPSGNFIWAKQMGGTKSTTGVDIALDASYNIYFTGYYNGIADFDPGAGVFNLTNIGIYSQDIFICKLSNAGNLSWAKSVSDTATSLNPYCGSTSIQLDAVGNVYTVGSFNGHFDFDPGVGSYYFTSTSGEFISKLDNNGNFIWAKEIEGTHSVKAFSITLDALGQLYITGEFYASADFDPGVGISILAPADSDYHTFVLKLNSLGDFVWVKQLGGYQHVFGPSTLTVDNDGNIFTTGYFSGSQDFDPGASNYILSSTTTGDKDIFLSKLDSNGNFVWAKQIKGNSWELTTCIRLDNAGNIYLGGGFIDTTDFDPGAGVYNLVATDSNFNGFVCKLDNSGNFIWASQFTNASIVYDIELDALSSVYSAGAFWNTVDFDPSAATYNLTCTNTVNDGFLCKLNPTSLSMGDIDQHAFQLSAFPNPTTSGSIHLVSNELLTNASLRIYSLTGETILKENSLKGRKFEFDLTNQANGLYIIEIEEANKFERIKFVKL